MRSLVRPVRLLAAGGTIAMSGERAVPALDAAELIAALPPLAAVPELSAENVLGAARPADLAAAGADAGPRACAAAAGRRGRGRSPPAPTRSRSWPCCARCCYGGDAPIVLTGANRPAEQPGADGPANLLDAVALAGVRAPRPAWG